MKKDDLYELVKTLSSSEKKVFKEKYAVKGESNFIRLFDAISAGDVTNDADAKKKFAKENFVQHLGKTKSYLYEVILSSLHEQIQPHYTRLRILQQIEFAETLLNRKLFSQAQDMLQVSLQMAKEAEEIELEQFLWSSLLLLTSHLHNSTDIYNNASAFQGKIRQCMDYGLFYFQLHNDYSSRGKKGTKDLNDYAQHPLLQKKSALLSSRALRTYEIIQSLLSTVQRDFAKAWKHNMHVVQLVKKVSKSTVLNETSYINALFNAILSRQSLGHDAKEIIEQLEAFEPIGRWAKSQRFLCLLRSKLYAYIIQERNAQGKELAHWVEKELPLYKHELNEQELVKAHMSIAGLYMKDKNFTRALDYLLLINHSKIARENRPIIYRVAWLYQLIANYELKDFGWLNSTLRNHKYFQKTNDTFYMIEEMVHEF
jgi:hypothetical protein